jgi:hypothetical protein
MRMVFPLSNLVIGAVPPGLEIEVLVKPEH